jgi:hypothetical protein
MVRKDGWIELLIPKVNKVWDHEYRGGTWTGDLASIEPDKEYQLGGVQNGDGQQHFDTTTMVWVGDALPLAGFERKLVLPPPKRISGANYVPVSPAKTFVHPDDPRVASITKINLLNVLSYDCPDLDAVRLAAEADDALPVSPRIVTDGSVNAVNLHIFAEPSTFIPLEKAKTVPPEETPFNTLVANLKGAENLMMTPPAPDDFSAADIDPGPPVPGLPESEKLALSQNAKYRRYGMLHDVDHPYNCGPVGGTTGGSETSAGDDAALPAVAALSRSVEPQAPATAFAMLRNSAPRVLPQPRVEVVYWGSTDVDPLVDPTVRKMLGLDFIKSALDEYHVDPPTYVKSVANPLGSKTRLQDAHESPATTHGSDIALGLQDMILAGKIDDPRKDPNLLYLIVGAPGAVSATPGVSGSHNYFYYPNAVARDRVPVHYAWALQDQPSGQASLDKLTLALSHELLEACTDPEPPYGYVFEGPEVCDIAAGKQGTENGILVSGYYSYRDHQFRTPTGQAAAQTA